MGMSEYFHVAMWIITIATAIVSVILGAVLSYHWRRFSYNPHVASISLGFYGIVTLALLLGMMTVIPAGI